MYAKRFGKRKAITARRPYKRVPRKRSGGRQAITKIVKSVLSRQAENKIWFDYGANQSISNTITAVPTFKNLVPVLSLGAGNTTRIGNQVTVKRGFVRGHVNLLPYEATLNNLPLPAYVKIWVLSCKQLNSTVLSGTNIANNLFDIPNSAVGMQGNMLDVDFTINKDAWVCHGTKTIKCGVGGYVNTGPVSGGSYFDNSSFSTPFYFNVGKYMKTIKYDDTSTTAQNKNMFLVFQVVPANGASGASQIMAEFHYQTRIEYEDM